MNRREKMLTENMAKVGYETLYEEKWSRLPVFSIERQAWLGIARCMLMEVRRLWEEVKGGE